MRIIFNFFLRLFICLVAAKFILRASGLESRPYLVGLTILFTANVYWLDYLGFRDRIFHRQEQERPRPGGVTGASPVPKAEETPPKITPPRSEQD